MKRSSILLALLLLLLLPVSFAQDFTLARALEVSPENARLVILSADGEIVGLSENLSRERLEILVSPGFSGSGTLLVTTADGGVLFEFAVELDSGSVTVEGEPLAAVLASAGFEAATFVTGAGLPEEADVEPELPNPAGNAPALPEEPNDPIGDDAGDAEGGTDHAEEAATEGQGEADDPADQDADPVDGAPDADGSAGDTSEVADDRYPVGTP